MTRRPTEQVNRELSRQQAAAVLARRPRTEHLPVALEQHTDPPELGPELATLRGLIRKAGKTRITETVLVTVKMARAMQHLGLHKKNRKVMQSKVAMIAHIMLEGRFRAIEPMRFDWDGEFRDGQHRSDAVISSGVAIKFDVTFGMDPEDFHFIDTGMRRNGAQFLDLDGIKHASKVATIVRMLYRIESGGMMLDDHAVYLRGVELADELMSRAIAAAFRLRRKDIIASSAAVAYRMIATGSRRKLSVDEFWDRFVLGDMLETSSPIYKLRERFAKGQIWRVNQYLYQTQHAAWIIKAWNAWVRGETPSSHKLFTWTEENELPGVE
jgi:hypothetical protein